PAGEREGVRGSEQWVRGPVLLGTAFPLTLAPSPSPLLLPPHPCSFPLTPTLSPPTPPPAEARLRSPPGGEGVSCRRLAGKAGRSVRGVPFVLSDDCPPLSRKRRHGRNEGYHETTRVSRRDGSDRGGAPDGRRGAR